MVCSGGDGDSSRPVLAMLLGSETQSQTQPESHPSPIALDNAAWTLAQRTWPNALPSSSSSSSPSPCLTFSELASKLKSLEGKDAELNRVVSHEICRIDWVHRLFESLRALDVKAISCLRTACRFATFRTFALNTSMSNPTTTTTTTTTSSSEEKHGKFSHARTARRKSVQVAVLEKLQAFVLEQVEGSGKMEERSKEFVALSVVCTSEMVAAFAYDLHQSAWADLILLLLKCMKGRGGAVHRVVIAALMMGQTVMEKIGRDTFEHLGVFVMNSLVEVFVHCFLNYLDKNEDVCKWTMDFLHAGRTLILQSGRYKDISHSIQQKVLQNQPNFFKRTRLTFFPSQETKEEDMTYSPASTCTSTPNVSVCKAENIERDLQTPEKRSTRMAVDLKRHDPAKPTRKESDASVPLKRSASLGNVADTEILSYFEQQGWVVENKDDPSQVTVYLPGSLGKMPGIGMFKTIGAIRYKFFALRGAHERTSSKSLSCTPVDTATHSADLAITSKRPQRRIKETARLSASCLKGILRRDVDDLGPAKPQVKEEVSFEADRNADGSNEEQPKQRVKEEVSLVDVKEKQPSPMAAAKASSDSTTPTSKRKMSWKCKLSIGAKVWGMVVLYVGLPREQQLRNWFPEKKNLRGKIKQESILFVESLFARIKKEEDPLQAAVVIQSSVHFLESYCRTHFSEPSFTTKHIGERVQSLVAYLQEMFSLFPSCTAFTVSVFYVWAYLLCSLPLVVLEDGKSLEMLVRPVLDFAPRLGPLSDQADDVQRVLLSWLCRWLFSALPEPSLFNESEWTLSRVHAFHVYNPNSRRSASRLVLPSIDLLPRSESMKRLLETRLLGKVLQVLMVGENAPLRHCHTLRDSVLDMVSSWVRPNVLERMEEDVLKKFRLEALRRVLRNRDEGMEDDPVPFWRTMLAAKCADLQVDELNDLGYVIHFLGKEGLVKCIGTRRDVLFSSLRYFASVFERGGSTSLDFRDKEIISELAVKFGSTIVEFLQVQHELVLAAFGGLDGVSIWLEMIGHLSSANSKELCLHRVMYLVTATRTESKRVLLRVLHESVVKRPSAWFGWHVDISMLAKTRNPAFVQKYITLKLSCARQAEWKPLLDAMFEVHPPGTQDKFWTLAFSLSESPFYSNSLEDAQLLFRLSQSESQLSTHSDTTGMDEILFKYPPKEILGVVAVRREDLEHLNSQALLNDTVIDFFLQYVIRETFPPAISERMQREMHLFASLLFQCWIDGDRFPNRKKKHRFFQKKFWIIPCNFDGHWSLCIGCNMNKFFEVDHTSGEAPFFLLLDSFSHDENVLRDVLREKVFQAYVDELKVTEQEQQDRVQEAANRIELVRAQVVQQMNLVDCGVYLCAFFEAFVKLLYAPDGPGKGSHESLKEFLLERINRRFVSQGKVEGGSGMRGRLRTLIRNKQAEYRTLQKEDNAQARSKFDTSLLRVFFDHQNQDAKRYFWVRLFDDKTKLHECPSLVELLVRVHATSFEGDHPFVQFVGRLFKQYMSGIPLQTVILLVSDCVLPWIQQVSSVSDSRVLCEGILDVIASRAREQQQLFTKELFAEWTGLIGLARQVCDVETDVFLRVVFPGGGVVVSKRKGSPTPATMENSKRRKLELFEGSQMQRTDDQSNSQEQERTALEESRLSEGRRRKIESFMRDTVAELQTILGGDSHRWLQPFVEL